MNPKLENEIQSGSMRAVRQHGPGGKLVMETVPLPVPGPGEVLIKMHASPINFSDLSINLGDPPASHYPFTPGLEGSGTVVKAGRGLFPALRKGKRVACTPVPGTDGTWAEYMVTGALRCTPLPGQVSSEQGSMMLVNPMTALAFMEMAKQGNHKAIVNNAAASALGKMLIRLSVKYGIPLISIVRREEQAEELRQMGARYVLNSSDPGFGEELHRLARELGATLLLDAIAGQQTSLLLGAAPQGSTVVVYGRLSREEISFEPGQLIREGKALSGFFLGRWLQSRGLVSRIRYVNQIGRMLSGTLASPVNRTMPLEQAEEAIQYYRDHMSAGKILLIPD